MTDKINCFHCGDVCDTSAIHYQNKDFCCAGCKTVFEILSESKLDRYYVLEDNPGLKIDDVRQSDQYAFLDQPEIKENYVLYSDDKITKITFSIPQIHCSSCIWLLENLSRLSKDILYSKVNFPKRKADITFDHNKISLREVAELLSTIGYDPDLSSSGVLQSTAPQDKKLVYQIGIAGFCFGNIMLFAFPEYFGLDHEFKNFKRFFGYISLGLSIPVFFYAGIDYITNAINGLRQKFINIDVPIALGMLTLLFRSAYEIITATGSGYLDSLSGLVFFLLIGKWFQRKTYDALSFDRDYKSYFPIAVNKIVNGKLIPTSIASLEIGDTVELKNQELIPSDSILIKGEAFIDYSFITGESDPIHMKSGDRIFAGGRQVGSKIVVELIKKVDNSYLTELWNQEVFTKEEKPVDLNAIVNSISKYFTTIILLITAIAAVYWWHTDASTIWTVVTAILIVACPCALALSVPFTLGNMMRILGQKGLFIKNTEVIEKLAEISHVILDKTGTITQGSSVKMQYDGSRLSTAELNAIAACASNSAHPLSMSVVNYINTDIVQDTAHFVESKGAGIEGEVAGIKIKMGSNSFLGINGQNSALKASQVHVSLNSNYKGYFFLNQQYRTGLKKVIAGLKKRFTVHILSGDNDGQRDILTNVYGMEYLFFNQDPIAKLNHIKNLQHQQYTVLMLGDGLNDAGALKQSDVGIALSDKVHQFSPACDAILSAEEFEHFNDFITLSRRSISIVYASFVISFLYNVIGLYFAVTGKLSPVIAAILMPISSISVVVFTTLATRLIANKTFN